MSMKTMKVLSVLLMALAVIAPVFANGTAEKAEAVYPSKEVTCIVIAAAGGGTDAMARAATNPLETIMGKPFVVVNNGSAGGLLAMEDIADSDPDGYTIGVFSNTDVASFAYGQKGCEFTVDDFTYIAGLNTTGDIIVLKKDSRFSNLEEFIAYAKANPKALTIGLPSPTQEMTLTLFENAVGAEFTGVVYGGGNKVFADLLGGHIEAGVLGAKFVKQAGENNLSILGLMLADRLSTYPDVPTFREQGYDAVNPAVRMIVGPKGIDQSVVDKLVAALEEGFEGAISENIKAQGEIPQLLTGAALDSFLKEDFAMRKAYYESK